MEKVGTGPSTLSPYLKYLRDLEPRMALPVKEASLLCHLHPHPRKLWSSGQCFFDNVEDNPAGSSGAGTAASIASGSSSGLSTAPVFPLASLGGTAAGTRTARNMKLSPVKVAQSMRIGKSRPSGKEGRKKTVRIASRASPSRKLI